MSDPQVQLLALAGAWLAYFALHSALASVGLKARVARRHPGLMPAYRLAFNTLAIVLLIPPAWLMLAWDGPWLWAWTGAAAWVANGLALAALLAFGWTLRAYDGGEFLGLRQWREGRRQVDDQERFHLSTPHRFVRHPWYFLGLVLVWTRDMDAARLLSAAIISLYFVVGSRLEERKLIRYHGEVYRRYREAVPGLIPLPGRRLSPAEARDLVRTARSEESSPTAGERP